MGLTRSYIRPIKGEWLESNLALQLGKSKLMRLDSDECKQLLNEVTEHINNSKSMSEASKEGWLKHIGASFSVEDAQTCSVTTVRAADSDHAESLGEAESQRFLSTLALFQYLVDKTPYNALINKTNSAGPKPLPTSVFTTKERLEWSLQPPQQPQYAFKFDNLALEKMREAGWDILVAIWRNDKPNELELRLKRAACWLGEAIADSDPVSAFLRFTIGLEILLVRKDETETITGALSERLAFILSNDSAKRRKIWEKTKELYGKRSRIVHSGNSEVDPGDLRQIRHFALICFMKLLKKSSELTSISQLIRFCEDKKFETAKDTQES